MDHTRTKSSVKLTDLGIIQPQSEGELTDILDSFLTTFEQHVSVSDSDIQDGMVPNITDETQTCGQSYTVHTNAHATSLNTKTPGSKASLSQNRPRLSSACRPQKPSCFWQVSGVKMEKSTGQQSEQKPKSGRMTRSQSRRKRKLEVFEELPRRDDELPAKQKRKRKKEQIEKTKLDASLPNKKKRKKKTSRLHSELVSTADSSCSVASALSKVINTASGQNVKCVTQTTKTLDRSKSELHAYEVSSFVKEKQVGHAKKYTTKTLLEGSTFKVQCSTGSSQPKLSATKNESTGSRPALSAFDLMKKILENHEEHKGNNNRMWTVKKQKGKERLANTHVRGAEVKMTEDKEKNARVEGQNKSRINQNDKERSGRIKEAGNQKNIVLQNLPAANGESSN